MENLPDYPHVLGIIFWIVLIVGFFRFVKHIGEKKLKSKGKKLKLEEEKLKLEEEHLKFKIRRIFKSKFLKDNLERYDIVKDYGKVGIAIYSDESVDKIFQAHNKHLFLIILRLYNVSQGGIHFGESYDEIPFPGEVKNFMPASGDYIEKLDSLRNPDNNEKEKEKYDTETITKILYLNSEYGKLKVLYTINFDKKYRGMLISDPLKFELNRIIDNHYQLLERNGESGVRNFGNFLHYSDEERKYPNLYSFNTDEGKIPFDLLLENRRYNNIDQFIYEMMNNDPDDRFTLHSWERRFLDDRNTRIGGCYIFLENKLLYSSKVHYDLSDGEMYIDYTEISELKLNEGILKSFASINKKLIKKYYFNIWADKEKNLKELEITRGLSKGRDI